MGIEPLRIVSVSLGSSKRDKTVRSELLGVPLQLDRKGVDGKLYRAVELISRLAPEVQAIGLGGIDLYLFAGNRRYVVRDALKLARAAGTTPVADGSQLKRILEPQQMEYLLNERPDIPVKGKKVLMVSAVDRTGMAQVLDEAAGEIVFGDLFFGLGVPLPLRSYRAVVNLARALLPLITKLPFQVLYPTGEKQEKVRPKHRRWLEWA
ncbi:quinate 5-dehydrogenase, partial [bacterium]|nr:quinate 5-dehydrogenase [bacterium]